MKKSAVKLSRRRCAPLEVDQEGGGGLAVAVRDALGLSWADLATALRCDRSAVYRWKHTDPRGVHGDFLRWLDLLLQRPARVDPTRWGRILVEASTEATRTGVLQGWLRTIAQHLDVSERSGPPPTGRRVQRFELRDEQGRIIAPKYTAAAKAAKAKTRARVAPLAPFVRSRLALTQDDFARVVKSTKRNVIRWQAHNPGGLHGDLLHWLALCIRGGLTNAPEEWGRTLVFALDAPYADGTLGEWLMRLCEPTWIVQIAKQAEGDGLRFPLTDSSPKTKKRSPPRAR